MASLKKTKQKTKRQILYDALDFLRKYHIGPAQILALWKPFANGRVDRRNIQRNCSGLFGIQLFILEI